MTVIANGAAVSLTPSPSPRPAAASARLGPTMAPPAVASSTMLIACARPSGAARSLAA